MYQKRGRMKLTRAFELRKDLNFVNPQKIHLLYLSAQCLFRPGNRQTRPSITRMLPGRTIGTIPLRQQPSSLLSFLRSQLLDMYISCFAIGPGFSSLLSSAASVRSNGVSEEWIYANAIHAYSRMDRVHWPYIVKPGKSKLVHGALHPTDSLDIAGPGAVCGFDIYDTRAYCTVTRCRAALHFQEKVAHQILCVWRCLIFHCPSCW